MSAGERRALSFDLDEGQLDVTVEGISRFEYRELRDDHPPPGEGEAWGPGFPGALLVACVREPRLTRDLAAEWADDLEVGPDLLEACLAVSQPGPLAEARDALRRDPRLAAEVAYCGKAGIPHVEFLMWPDRSQDVALAWQELHADVCPGCGVPSKDQQDPDAWGLKASACVHCEHLSQARQDVPEEHRDRIHHQLVPPAPDAQQGALSDVLGGS